MASNNNRDRRAYRAAIPVLLAALVACAAAPAAAQGRGNAFGKGRRGSTPATSSTAPAAETASPAGLTGSGVRQFGTWLDDGSVSAPGSGWVGLSFGSYASPAGRQTDFPVIDAAFGLTRRVQVGMTLPSYSHFSAVDGSTFGGRGDIYLNAKISLRNRLDSPSRSAVAITPLIEILSQPDPRDGGRVFWGLPISAELRRDSYRLYGSTGVFSRGSLFAGGAVEVPASNRVILTGALSWARSMADAPEADAEGLASARLDLTGSAVYVVNPSFAVFGGLGRTLSHIDVNGSTMVVNGGVGFSFARRAARPPSRRP